MRRPYFATAWHLHARPHDHTTTVRKSVAISYVHVLEHCSVKMDTNAHRAPDLHMRLLHCNEWKSWFVFLAEKTDCGGVSKAEVEIIK